MSISPEAVALSTSPQLYVEVAEALVGDVEPDRLEAFNFAVGILPAFRLIRSLFSQNELDSCLKLMVLHELSRAGGRSSLERIRALCRFLDADRVDALARSLREGGWLDLRASDNTYALSATGLNLLSLLHAADLGNLTPANMLARAAQNAVFGATLDGGGNATAYLLDALLVLLEDQAEDARAVLRSARPARMIAWSHRRHARQLETLRQVLGALQERMDASSREFTRIVRLHETMQDIIQLHTSIHTRLRDWNLERLYTAEAGYSLPQLAEAVLGVDDRTLEALADAGGVLVPALPAGRSTEELCVRFQGARRRLPSQREDFTYAPPPEPAGTDFAAAPVDPASALRAHLTACLEGRAPEDAPLAPGAWLPVTEPFPSVAYTVALLARLDGDDARVSLADGRVAALDLVTDLARGVGPAELLAHLEDVGAMEALPVGHVAKVQVGVAGP